MDHMDHRITFCEIFAKMQWYDGERKQVFLSLLSESIRRLFSGEKVNGYNRKIEVCVYDLDFPVIKSEMRHFKNISVIQNDDKSTLIKASFGTIQYTCERLLNEKGILLYGL